MSLKLNMSKVYDKVECDYLEHTLNVLGFPTKFIKLIMQCVKTASFSILINSSSKGSILPSRGLYQGDPPLPYLFLLWTKGLANLLNNVAQIKSLIGIKVCRGAPSVYHLLFTNNNLIFCKAGNVSSQQVLNLLNWYAQASGQCINTDKTTMVFSKNVKRDVKEEIMARWGYWDTKYEKYLGLPRLIGRSKKKSISDIKIKLWKRLQS